MGVSINTNKTLGVAAGTSIIAPQSSSVPYSILLDGTDAYIDCGTASELNFERTDSFSFSFWVKRNSTGTSDVVIARQNAAGNMRGYFVNINTDDQLVIQLRHNTSNNSQRLNVQSTSLIQDTNWHHMIITYDGTSTVNSFCMYIDGRKDVVTDKLGTLSDSILAPTAPFLMGTLHTGIAAPADVYLDEVAVFDSVLTDGGVGEGQAAGGQVADIYNCGIPNDISSLNPVSYWRFNEGSGTTTADSGSASNTGTLENDASFDTDVPTNVIAFANTKSIDLDGINDYVTMGPDTLEFNRTTPFSISVWWNPQQAELSSIIGNTFNGGNYQGYYLWQSQNGSNVRVNCRLRKSSSHHVQFQGTVNLSLNQWYHLVMTYDGTGVNTGLKLYIDGADSAGSRQGVMNQDIDWTSHSIPFNLGARMNGNLPLNGLIDEVGVFDSELSATDVSDIYNSGAPTSLASLSPVCWWRCGDAFDTNTRLINQGSLCTIQGVITNVAGSPFSSDVPT